MAEPYRSQLKLLISQRQLPGLEDASLEVKHFFSGAALYANGTICATLSPKGFALKLPPEYRQRLIRQEHGTEFRFFVNGPVKREYTLISETIMEDDTSLEELIVASLEYVLNK